MKYILSAIVGFVLTLALSLPLQNVVRTKEAKAMGSNLRAKALSSETDMDLKIPPLVRLESSKDEPNVKFFPQYPALAASQRIEGYVTLRFRVARDGSVQALRVVESNPPTVFDQAALDAVSKWSFAAKSERKAIKEEQQLRLNFNLGRSVAVENQGSY